MLILQRHGLKGLSRLQKAHWELKRSVRVHRVLSKAFIETHLVLNHSTTKIIHQNLQWFEMFYRGLKRALKRAE